MKEVQTVFFQRVEWSSTQKQIEMKEKILLLLGDHKVREKHRFDQNYGETFSSMNSSTDFW